MRRFFPITSIFFCLVLQLPWIYGSYSIAEEQLRTRPLEEIILSILPPDEDDEASGLTPIMNPSMLGEGWETGFWVILDEPSVENAIARMGRRPASVGEKPRWEIEIVPAHVKNGLPDATSDCEAIARLGDHVYIFGSHFGRKKGPLEDLRQFAARFEDRPNGQPRVDLEVAHNHFTLHRMINDALTSHGIELIERGPAEYDKYITKTFKKEPEAAKYIRQEDRAVNIEGAAFTKSGTLLLGLRYPVTLQGNPIIIEIEDIERLFTGGKPVIRRFRVVENVGTPQEPAGIRDMLTHDSSLEILTGNLDRFAGKKEDSVVLEDHPEGLKAASKHYRIAWPPAEGTGDLIKAGLVRDFAPRNNAEGLSADAQGRFHYIFDGNRVLMQYELTTQY